MSEAEIWDVKRLLQWTAGFFTKHGSSSARLDAEVLLAWVMGLKRIELYTHFDTIPTDKERAQFREFVKRHGAGEPVAYLVEHKEFYSLDFKVTRDTLIPRPETEQLVLEGIEFFRSRARLHPEGTTDILDIGTGSGCIAIALAKNLPNAKVTAVDISQAALSVAQENAKRHRVEDRITFLQSDLFDALPQGVQFDLLVSNPPYIASAEYDALPGNVKQYEPKSALLAGPTGSEIIERILSAVGSKENNSGFLRPGGRLLIELSPMIADQTLEYAQSIPRLTDRSVLTDFAGLKRIVSAKIPE